MDHNNSSANKNIPLDSKMKNNNVKISEETISKIKIQKLKFLYRLKY